MHHSSTTYLWESSWGTATHCNTLQHRLRSGPRLPGLLPADAHGGGTSTWWSVPGTRNNALIKENHHYRLGLMCDLAMGFCLSKLSPPKPNKLRSGPRLPGQVISDRTGAYLASVAKARSKNFAWETPTVGRPEACMGVYLLGRAMLRSVGCGGH